MKAIMKSESPKRCEQIARGKCTLLISKTRPKLEPPFVGYIYCTKGKQKLIGTIRKGDDIYGTIYEQDKPTFIKIEEYSLVGTSLYGSNGKVIGEFVCDEIVDFLVFENKAVQNWSWFDLAQSCLTYEQIGDYIGANKTGYAWHISNLKIYDTPKELREFTTPCPSQFAKSLDCSKGYKHCKYFVEDRVPFECTKEGLTRPPQSWCYVEELKEN